MLTFSAGHAPMACAKLPGSRARALSVVDAGQERRARVRRPHTVLTRMLDRFAALSLTPRVAFEMEIFRFYRGQGATAAGVRLRRAQPA